MVAEDMNQLAEHLSVEELQETALMAVEDVNKLIDLSPEEFQECSLMAVEDVN